MQMFLAFLVLCALFKVIKVVKDIKVVTRALGSGLESSLLFANSVHALGESTFGEEIFLQAL